MEEAKAILDAHEQEHAGLESAHSRKGKRREWAHRAHLAQWHAESAAKWITPYATQLSPRSQPSTHEILGDPGYRIRAGQDATAVPLDPDEPSGE